MYVPCIFMTFLPSHRIKFIVLSDLIYLIPRFIKIDNPLSCSFCRLDTFD